MRVVTNEGALRVATRSGVAAKSRAAAFAGRDAAKRRARVDTGEMRDGIVALALGGWGHYRVLSQAPHSKFNEYGTSKMSAKPFVRPSQAEAIAALA